MRTAKEIYPDYWEDEQKNGSFYGPGNYQPIIDDIGKVLIQVDDNDYQGDTRVIFEKDGKYGYLNFGWGSCSGCDSLQACNKTEDIQRLMDEIVSSIYWFDSIDALQTYFKEKDWELEYSWHQEETRDFIQKVLDFGK